MPGWCEEKKEADFRTKEPWNVIPLRGGGEEEDKTIVAINWLPEKKKATKSESGVFWPKGKKRRVGTTACGKRGGAGFPVPGKSRKKKRKNTNEGVKDSIIENKPLK